MHPHSLRETARTLAAAIAKCSSNPPTPAALQRALRGYSAEASMQCGFAPGPPRVRRSSHDDEGDDRAARRFLLLASGLQPASAYRKGDLWVVSNQPTLQAVGRGDWVTVLRSQWHGPSRDQGKCVCGLWTIHHLLMGALPPTHALLTASQEAADPRIAACTSMHPSMPNH